MANVNINSPLVFIASQLQSQRGPGVNFQVVPRDTTAPTVQIIAPTPSSKISPTQVITAKIADDSQLLRRVVLTVMFPDLDLEEVIHNGTRFGLMYDGPLNVRTTLVDGYSIDFLRRGGWPSANMQLDVIAIDAAGNEA